tara:strand:+ start:103 stop:1590 length:1488 start_codon:yes stop_codon:yes gene_type:complete
MGKFNLVIPAAGAATRLKPLSSNMSKVMVRVNGKPCLDYIIEAVNGSVEEIVIVDGKFEDIREYCKIKHPRVKFVNQPKLNGPRDAINIGIKKLKHLDKPLVVWLGDAIILEKDLPLGEDFLLTKEVEDQSSWCMWDGMQYYNKPKWYVDDAVALVGLYSFGYGPGAAKAFDETDEYDISHALENYAEEWGSFNKIVTDKWYDIGDLPTYYKTCAELLNLKSRAFNNLQFNAELGTIRKTPDYHNEHSISTLKNEKLWYEKLSPEQSMFVPRILPHNTDLIMSYESGILLSDLMLYENLPSSVWDYILEKIFTIKLKYFNDPVNSSELVSQFSKRSLSMWLYKSQKRLEDNEAFTRLEKEQLLGFAREIHKKTKPIEVHHGDFHFGNILYNQYTDQFKLIDPRGEYGNIIGTIGDNYYDWAKLSHDLHFGYSSIINDVPHNNIVNTIFIEKITKYNLDYDLIIKGGLLLLATCIPLHYDDKNRQKRMIKKVKESL